MATGKKEFNKKITGLKLKDSSEVWFKVGGKHYIKNPDLVYGKVEKHVPGVICEKIKNEVRYLDDFVNLPKNSKKEIIDKFYNHGKNNKQVQYLVKNGFDKKNELQYSRLENKKDNNPKKPKTPSGTNTKANKNECCNDSRLIAPIQGKKVKMAMNNYYTYKNSKKKDK